MPIVGDVLGERYRIEGVLGAGGMASVYRAIDLRLEREVAVKVLLPNLARDPNLAERFDREARMLAAVAHPGVAAVFDVDAGDPATGQEPFYVMELCDGGSLADRIEAGGRLDPGDVIPTITAVAQGLAELHQQGLIHRDVKPGNILFCGGRPKLADFGLARADASSDQTTLTAPGTTVGTLGYLAPELLRGGQPTIASDTYGLGVTAFHALTGRVPWPGDRLAHVVATQAVPAPLVSSVAPKLGMAFDGPCAAALAEDPSRRPGPQRFAADLEDAMARWMDDPRAPAPDGLTETVVVTPVPSATGAESTALPVAALPTAAKPAAAPAKPAAAPAKPSPGPAEPSGVVADANPTTPVLAVLGILAILLAVAVLGLLLAQGGPVPSASAPAPSSELPPSPAATVDASSAAQAALEAVIAAIDQARGGRDGLRGNDANDLQALAEDVRRALAAGNMGAAEVAAERLAERAEDVTEELDEARREALEAAIDALREAIPAR